MTKIIEALLEYFKDRLELSKDLVPFSAFGILRHSSFESLAQRRIDSGFKEPKAYPVCLENLVGFKEVREKELSDLNLHAKEIASALYRCAPDAVHVKKCIFDDKCIKPATQD